MKTLLVFLAFSFIQANSLQDQPVVHLQHNHSNIQVEYGGDLVELNDAPAEVYLPKLPPKPDLKAKPWPVDVKNLGPGSVTVFGSDLFSVRIEVGKTVHIYSNGSAYSLKP
ncbi:MAG: hypothetical protein ACLPY1_22845 [Terracidiphilus sp.]